MTHFMPTQRFIIQYNGRDVIAKSGTAIEIDSEKANDLCRAGYGFLVSTSAPALTKAVKQEMQNSPVADPWKREGTAALIVNYNMPERTDKLVEYIRKNVKSPVEIIVIDNGSDISAPSQYTSLRLEKNVQTTNGWLMGLRYLDALAQIRNCKPEFYWFIITSAEFGIGDPLTPLVEQMHADPLAAAISPVLQSDCVTAWQHMITTGEEGVRQTWMIDNIAALYRADWFDAGARFDPALTYAWGIDLEACWMARRDGRTIWLHEDVQVTKITDIGYTMGRMNQGAQERRNKATLNMNTVLSARYGEGWEQKFRTEFMPKERKSSPTVSIIVPTFNRPELLERALISISEQTYKDFEAIVVNDNGVDVSKIVKKFPFARYYAHKKNKGLSAARNTALKHARGHYITYLDDDDWYYRNHLSTLVDALEDGGFRFVYSDADRESRHDPRYLMSSNDFDRNLLRQHNILPVCCAMHEKSVLDEVGLFDESLYNTCEDWDMWNRMADVLGAFKHIKIVTCVVDRTRVTLSSDKEHMTKGHELIRARYAKK